MVEYEDYFQRMEDRHRCMVDELSDRYYRNPTGMTGKQRMDEERDAMFWAKEAALRSAHERIVSSANRPMAPTASNTSRPAASSSGGSPGIDCAQLERESTLRIQQLEARMQSSGLCETYGIAIELGQIGDRMYSSCPILDPTGANLAAARQMMADGRSGQASTCSR